MHSLSRNYFTENRFFLAIFSQFSGDEFSQQQKMTHTRWKKDKEWGRIVIRVFPFSTASETLLVFLFERRTCALEFLRKCFPAFSFCLQLEGLKDEKKIFLEKYFTSLFNKIFKYRQISLAKAFPPLHWPLLFGLLKSRLHLSHHSFRLRSR